MIKYELTPEAKERLEEFKPKSLIDEKKYNTDQLKRIEMITGVTRELARLILTSCPKTENREAVMGLCKSVIRLASSSMRYGEGGTGKASASTAN